MQTSLGTILVTGGAGYIGSHTCVALLEAGYHVVIYDNLSNSHREVLARIENITGKAIDFIIGDVRDAQALKQCFASHNITAVIHFAGLKAVGESVNNPLKYFDHNVHGTTQLLQAMQNAKVKKIIFSSSATVYGEPHYLPFDEGHPLAPTNPYGHTKRHIEDILSTLTAADSDWRVGILRYFNPVGAHPSGKIGEDPQGTPNNLMPYIAQVAIGQRKALNIWGNDYKTHDGTGVRDYIHVMDLAHGHLKALIQLQQSDTGFTVNLGTGKGASVLDVVKAFELASSQSIAYVFEARRPGDIDAYYADVTKAKELLDWQAQHSLNDMCVDHWRWQQANPNGYQHQS